MNNSDFQKLASIRLKEAQVLFREQQYASAYYLAGYAVECGLKACIAAQTRAGEFPPKPDIVRGYYQHDLNGLVKAAGLRRELETQLESTVGFIKNGKLFKTGQSRPDMRLR